MITNLKLNIEVELLGLSDSQLFEIIHMFETKFTSDFKYKFDSRIDFESFNKIFHISDRPYNVSSVEMPDLSNDSMFIGNAEINIIG